MGIEVTKMLKGNPLASLELIESLDLYTSIFDCGIQVSGNDALATAQILSHLPFETDAMLWFAAATSPFRDKTVKGKKDLPAVSVLISEGLKVSASTVNTLMAAPKRGQGVGNQPVRCLASH